jgi:hypothetical protein
MRKWMIGKRVISARNFSSFPKTMHERRVDFEICQNPVSPRYIEGRCNSHSLNEIVIFLLCHMSRGVKELIRYSLSKDNV